MLVLVDVDCPEGVSLKGVEAAMVASGVPIKGVGQIHDVVEPGQVLVVKVENDAKPGACEYMAGLLRAKDISGMVFRENGGVYMEGLDTERVAHILETSARKEQMGALMGEYLGKVFSAGLDGSTLCRGLAHGIATKAPKGEEQADG